MFVSGIVVVDYLRIHKVISSAIISSARRTEWQGRVPCESSLETPSGLSSSGAAESAG